MPPRGHPPPARTTTSPAAATVVGSTRARPMPRRRALEERRAGAGRSRIAHLLETDPGGAGSPRTATGASSASRSRSCATASGACRCSPSSPGRQGRGVGRRLLEAALGHADGARGAIIAQLDRPEGDAPLRARRASTCGRCVAARGDRRPRRAAAARPGVRTARATTSSATAASRGAVRGGAYARAATSRTLLRQRRGPARPRRPRLRRAPRRPPRLLARDRRRGGARDLLWSCLARGAARRHRRTSTSSPPARTGRSTRPRRRPRALARRPAVHARRPRPAAAVAALRRLPVTDRRGGGGGRAPRGRRAAASTASRPLDVAQKSSAADLVSEADRAAEAAVVELLAAERPATGSSARRARAATARPHVGRRRARRDVQLPVGRCRSSAPRWRSCRTASRSPPPWSTRRRASCSAPRAARARPATARRCACARAARWPTRWSRRTPTRACSPRRRCVALVRSAAVVRTGGAGGLELAWLAAGRIDGWAQIGTQPWDWLPGALLVREAGGHADVRAGGAAPRRRQRLARRRARSGARLAVELELAQLGPARVGLALVLVRLGVEVLAALRAQAGAVVAADDLGRQRERERVARPARAGRAPRRVDVRASRARRRRRAGRPRARRPSKRRRASRRGSACTARRAARRSAGAGSSRRRSCARRRARRAPRARRRAYSGRRSSKVVERRRRGRAGAPRPGLSARRPRSKMSVRAAMPSRVARRSRSARSLVVLDAVVAVVAVAVAVAPRGPS